MASAPALTADDTASAEHPLNARPRRPSRSGELTWEVACAFPRQGEWTEEEYLTLDLNWLIEYSDGVLEFLHMPTYFHQKIVRFLYTLLNGFVEERGLGEVLFAPLPVRLWTRKYREPDLIYLSKARIPRNPRSQPDGADLVAEVVSPGEENRERDLVTKPEEYARAGIQEYWIIDPELRSIKVLVLDGGTYRLHGEFRSGDTASSVLLDGFSVSVDEVFASGETAAS